MLNMNLAHKKAKIKVWLITFEKILLMTHQTVFVTGGTGLVGSHLLVKLTQEGAQVRALKRDGSDLSIVESIFEFYNCAPLYQNIEWVNGDITDITSLPEAIGNATKAYHTAALVSFDPNDKQKLYKINIEGTANVVNACLEANIKKLCYVSSTAAVGTSMKGKAHGVESNEWVEEEVDSNYALSKHYAENEVWRGVAEGLGAVMVNPSVVIGPGDWNRSSGTLFKTVFKGLKFYTPGSNAFVDVRDVADAMYVLMESDISEERFLLIGENLSFLSLFTKIAAALNVKPPTVLVKGVLIGFAWRIEKVRSFITRTNPVVTKESAQSATSDVTYSAQKFIDATSFKFRDINEASKNAAAFFLKK